MAKVTRQDDLIAIINDLIKRIEALERKVTRLT
jgi:hypothetical protein